MNAFSSIGVVPMFTKSFTPFLGGLFRHFVGVHHSGSRVIDHPDYEPGGATPIIYDPPVLDCSTAAYTVSRLW